jgi:hypothetical protein
VQLQVNFLQLVLVVPNNKMLLCDSTHYKRVDQLIVWNSDDKVMQFNQKTHSLCAYQQRNNKNHDAFGVLKSAGSFVFFKNHIELKTTQVGQKNMSSLHLQAHYFSLTLFL